MENYYNGSELKEADIKNLLFQSYKVAVAEEFLNLDLTYVDMYNCFGLISDYLVKKTIKCAYEADVEVVKEYINILTDRIHITTEEYYRDKITNLSMKEFKNSMEFKYYFHTEHVLEESDYQVEFLRPYKKNGKNLIIYIFI